jgi:hypothetical protein
MTIHRTATGVAVALALAAGASTASARPFNLDTSGSFVPAGAAAQLAASAIGATRPASTPPTVVRVIATSATFDWADAGIGAAGGIALTFAGLGGARSATQRRARRGHHSTALTG